MFPLFLISSSVVMVVGGVSEIGFLVLWARTSPACKTVVNHAFIYIRWHMKVKRLGAGTAITIRSSLAGRRKTILFFNGETFFLLLLGIIHQIILTLAANKK